MYPYLKKAGINKQDDQRQIVKHILDQFGNTLTKLSDNYPDSQFSVVDTRGTLVEKDWLNEIHPTSRGFKKIANRIYKEGILPALV